MSCSINSPGGRGIALPLSTLFPKTESLTKSSEARLVAGKPHQYSHLYISQHWGYRHTHDLAQLFHGSAVLNSGPHVCSKWFNQLNHMLSSTSH